MSSFLYRPRSRSVTGPVTPPCCARPRIFHSDQGVQYTSDEMTVISLEADIRISMCGRGRCYDNILNERLWRSVKNEEVYLNEYATLHEARARLQAYFACHKHQRSHQGCRLDAVRGVHRPAGSRPDSAASMNVNAIHTGTA